MAELPVIKDSELSLDKAKPLKRPRCDICNKKKNYCFKIPVKTINEATDIDQATKDYLLSLEKVCMNCWEDFEEDKGVMDGLSTIIINDGDGAMTLEIFKDNDDIRAELQAKIDELEIKIPLLKSGITQLEAIQIAYDVSGILEMERELERLREELANVG